MRIERLVIFAIVLIGLSSCEQRSRNSSPVSETPAPRQTKVVYFAPELFAGQSVIMEGFVRRAEAKGWSVQVANANGDAEVQNRQIAHYRDQGVDAMVAVPVDSAAIAPAVREARAKGIPFFSIDRSPIGVETDLCVMSDNFLPGVQSGEFVLSALKKKHGRPMGTVLELQGDLRQNVAMLRGAGFHSVVDAYPEIKVISRRTDWLSSKTGAMLEEVLDAERLDAIYMHSDFTCVPVILPILKERGLLKPAGDRAHVILAGVDGSSVTLDGIRSGWVDQASLQFLDDFGIIVEWIERRLSGSSIETGRVSMEGYAWSPAEIVKSEIGPTLLLPTVSIDAVSIDAVLRQPEK